MVDRGIDGLVDDDGWMNGEMTDRQTERSELCKKTEIGCGFRNAAELCGRRKANSRGRMFFNEST